MNRLGACCVSFAAVILSTAPTTAQSPKNTISVPVSGLQGDAGNVRCGLYASAATFRKAGQEAMGVVAPIKSRAATCVFSNVPSGTYAVAAFHAAKGETQISYGLFGKPDQGYGFSRNPASLFGPPAFSAASFVYKGGPVSMPVTLSY
jgi:uncharacterized protein (DUF2141 family)